VLQGKIPDEAVFLAISSENDAKERGFAEFRCRQALRGTFSVVRGNQISTGSVYYRHSGPEPQSGIGA
jgi:hypothetical protein